MVLATAVSVVSVSLDVYDRAKTGSKWTRNQIGKVFAASRMQLDRMMRSGFPIVLAGSFVFGFLLHECIQIGPSEGRD